MYIIFYYWVGFTLEKDVLQLIKMNYFFYFLCIYQKGKLSDIFLYLLEKNHDLFSLLYCIL